MATPEEIRKLEWAVAEAQAALTRARAENQRADEAWTRMLAEANASIARGKSVSAQFILGAAERARAGQVPAGQGVEKRPVVVPLHKWRSTEHFSFYDPSSKDRK
jgi:hypothetical protein